MRVDSSLEYLLTIIASFEVIYNYEGRTKAVEYANSLDAIPRLLLKKYDEVCSAEEDKYFALEHYASIISGENRNESSEED